MQYLQDLHSVWGPHVFHILGVGAKMASVPGHGIGLGPALDLGRNRSDLICPKRNADQPELVSPHLKRALLVNAWTMDGWCI